MATPCLLLLMHPWKSRVESSAAHVSQALAWEALQSSYLPTEHHYSFMASCHSITKWFGLEGILQTVGSNPPAMGRDPFHWIRLPQAPSNLALDTAGRGQPQLLWAAWARTSPPSW